MTGTRMSRPTSCPQSAACCVCSLLLTAAQHADSGCVTDSSSAPRCREALEAEAQKVAQLAVNAEGAVNKARRQLDEAQTDLGAAQATRAKAAAAVEELRQLMAAKAGAVAQGELGHGGQAGGVGSRAGLLLSFLFPLFCLLLPAATPPQVVSAGKLAGACVQMLAGCLVSLPLFAPALIAPPFAQFGTLDAML